MQLHRTLAGLSVAACLLATTSAVAATLNEELKGLLETHPQIKSAEKTLTSSQEATNAAEATYYPTVTVTGTYGFEHINNPTRRSTNNDPWDLPRQEVALSVTQSLYDATRTPAVLSSRFSELESESSLVNTTQATMFQGISAYLDVLKLNELVKIANSNVQTILDQADLEDERVQRGSGISLDVLRAKSRLKDARRRLVEFERLREEAVAAYEQVFGHLPVVDTMTEPDPPIGLLPPEVTEAIEVAQTENPQIAQSNALIEVAAEAKATAQGGYLPTVDLVGAMTYEKDENVVIGIRRDWSVLVEASWDVFDGYATRAEVAQSAADYGAAKDNLNLVLRQVEEQTKVAWHQFQTARERLEILENAVVIAQEVFDSTRELRDEGKETVLNVLDAEREVYLAQLERVIALYDTKLAVYTLLLNMGRLNIEQLESSQASAPAQIHVRTEPAPSAEPQPAPVAAGTAPAQPAAGTAAARSVPGQPFVLDYLKMAAEEAGKQPAQ